jgi:ubiquinone/menaquinone biosynthesis C-methylase UbiE
MMSEQAQAVRADFDLRSPRWLTVYDGPTYHDHVLRDRMRIALATIDRLASSPGRVLDVGCGAGHLLVQLAGRGWTVNGCDLAARQAHASAQHLEHVGVTPAVIQAEGTRLPFADASFDLVTGLGYLEYLDDQRAGLREMARVLSPAGLLVVSSPNKLRLSYLLDPIGVLRGALLPDHRGYRRTYQTKRGLARLLERGGLRPVEVIGHSIGRYTMGGTPLSTDSRAIALDRALQRRLPNFVPTQLGANLVAAAVLPS